MQAMIALGRGHRRHRSMGLIVAAGAVLAIAGCGSGGKGAERASCFPPCVANLVKRCPLVTACQANLEPNPSVANAGESNGVAVCFSSGEKLRTASDDANRNAVYIKAADGSECYSAVGGGTVGVEHYDVSSGGTLIAGLDWNLTSGAVTITCDGTTTQVTSSAPECQGLPWRNTVGCASDALCTFGTKLPPPAWDAGMPPPGCVSAECTSPPADNCYMNPIGPYTVSNKYSNPGYCDVNGCTYPLASTPCGYGCYDTECTGRLSSASNVTGVITGTTTPVTLSGGGMVRSTQGVTVTVQTSPRGAATSVQMRLTTDRYTTTMYFGFAPDPTTPSNQADYDRWTTDIPPLPAGSMVQFYMTAEGYGVLANVPGPTGGADWTYASTF